MAGNAFRVRSSGAVSLKLALSRRRTSNKVYISLQISIFPVKYGGLPNAQRVELVILSGESGVRITSDRILKKRRRTALNRGDATNYTVSIPGS